LIRVLILISLILGCSSDSLEVTGLIISVESKEVNKLEKLTLKDVDGKIWIFNGDNKSFPHFTSHHLKEHQVSGHSVNIKYEQKGKELLLISIEDSDEKDH
jgi:hypothetical protein